MACLMWLFRLTFCSYVAFAPFPLWWCRRHGWLDDLVLSYWISLIGLSLMLHFHVVVAFVFVWSSSSLPGCLVLCFCVRVHLHMGVLFVVFCGHHVCLCMVAKSNGWISELVAKTNTRVAWGWCRLRVALLGWCCLRVALLEGGPDCLNG